jgi:hypothetical protein
MKQACLILFLLLVFRQNFAQSVTNDVQVQTMKDLYTIHAKLIDKNTGWPAAGKTAYVSVPGRVFEFRMATSDSAGNIVFLVKNFESARQFIFQTNVMKDSNLVFELQEPIAHKFDADKYPKRIKDVGDTLPFYGKADRDYVLDDYVRFPTMEEVFREFVQEVKVRRQRDRYRIEVQNAPYYNVFFPNEPLVLLDGVPVFDTNLLMAIDPLKIRNIHVVSRKYYFGSNVLSGIVSLTSYDGDLAGYTIPRQALVRDLNPGSP